MFFTAHVELPNGKQTTRTVEAPGIRSAWTHANATLGEGEILRGVTDNDPGDREVTTTEHKTQVTRRGSGWGFTCSCGAAPSVSSKQRRVAEQRANIHAASER